MAAPQKLLRCGQPAPSRAMSGAFVSRAGFCRSSKPCQPRTQTDSLFGNCELHCWRITTIAALTARTFHVVTALRLQLLLLLGSSSLVQQPHLCT
jgi:hypothetical protein